MSFLYPAILGGLAAVGIPIAIHLLNKFRVRVVDWGAMRFLADSLRKNERRAKVEDLILLILRCLAVAALVFAFARPVLETLTAGGESTGPLAAVVLLDNSASMTQSGGTEPRFDQAKQEIRSWLDARGTDLFAALYLVSDRTEPLIARPGADLTLFRKMLEVAQPSDRGTNLVQGIRQAYQALQSVTGRSREIRIYTDDQSSGWLQLEVRKLIAENPDIALKPVIIGKKGEDNIGITQLRMEGGIAAARQPCRIRVEVSNYGSASADGIPVSLTMDEGAVVNQAVLPPIPPGTSQAVDLIVEFGAPGPHTIEASIPPDALAVDNRRVLAVNVIKRMGVLIVEGGEAETTLDRDGYFLANALLPLSRDQISRHYLELKFAQPGTIRPETLKECAAVFLSNPGEIRDDTAQLLSDYVKQGGNVVIFPGPRTDPEAWKKVSAWNALLPADMGVLKTTEGENAALAWQSGDFEHPVTAIWNDPAQGSLATVKTLQYFPLTPKQNGENKAASIVRFSDGEPAAVEWQSGLGRVVLFASSASPQWNNLPVHPGFVPLLQRLMGYLNRTDESKLTIAPGEAFVMNVPEEWKGKDFAVRRPGSNTPQSAGQVLSDGGRTFVRYSNTGQLGAYHVLIGQEPIGVFSVQLDPKESDLRQLNPAELENLTKPPAEAAKISVAPRLTVSFEFWTSLLWIAILLAVAESALAHRFSQAK